MSRIAAGSAEGAEQRQELSGKERTVGLLLVLLVALMTCVFSTLDNAVTLVHSSGETDHRSMAQSAAGPQRSGGGLRVRLEEPPVHGADHVLRDDALHHRPVTAAGWPFGWGC